MPFGLFADSPGMLAPPIKVGYGWWFWRTKQFNNLCFHAMLLTVERERHDKLALLLLLWDALAFVALATLQL